MRLVVKEYSIVIAGEEYIVHYSFSTIKNRNEKFIPEVVKEDWLLVSEFWDSCMDMDTINKLGAAPLQPVLQRIKYVNSNEDVICVGGRARCDWNNVLGGLWSLARCVQRYTEHLLFRKRFAHSTFDYFYEERDLEPV